MTLSQTKVPADSELLKQFADRGDKNALECLVRRHLPACYRQAIGILGNQDAADDAIQEAMVKLCITAKKFDGRVTVGAWLGRLVHAASIDRWRADKRRKRHEAAYNQGVQAHAGASFDDLDTSAYNIKNALSALTDAQLQAVTMHYFGGYRVKDIATVLGCSVSTVKARLSRARTKLRQVGALILLLNLIERSYAAISSPTQAQIDHVKNYVIGHLGRSRYSNTEGSIVVSSPALVSLQVLVILLLVSLLNCVFVLPKTGFFSAELNLNSVSVGSDRHAIDNNNGKNYHCPLVRFDDTRTSLGGLSIGDLVADKPRHMHRPYPEGPIEDDELDAVFGESGFDRLVNQLASCADSSQLLEVLAQHAGPGRWQVGGKYAIKIYKGHPITIGRYLNITSSGDPYHRLLTVQTRRGSALLRAVLNAARRLRPALPSSVN